MPPSYPPITQRQQPLIEVGRRNVAVDGIRIPDAARGNEGSNLRGVAIGELDVGRGELAVGVNGLVNCDGLEIDTEGATNLIVAEAEQRLVGLARGWLFLVTYRGAIECGGDETGKACADDLHGCA